MLGESLHAKAAKQLVGLYLALALFVSLRYLLEASGLGLRALRAYYITAVLVAVLALAQYGVALWDLNSVVANFPVHNSTMGATRSLVTGNNA